MDRLTRAFYASAGAAVAALCAIIVVMLFVSAPGFRLKADREFVNSLKPAELIVGDISPTASDS